MSLETWATIYRIQKGIEYKHLITVVVKPAPHHYNVSLDHASYR